MNKLSKLAFIAATAVLASAGQQHGGKTEAVKPRRQEYEDFPVDQSAMAAKPGKRGGRGKGRKWWNS